MTLSNYSRFRGSPDRKVRAEAVTAFFATLRQFQHAFAAIFAGQYELDVFYARARGYDTALEAYLDKDNIPVAVHDNLIAAVNANLEPLHRYVELRRKVLGLDDLHIYDLYVPMVEAAEMDVPYTRAMEILPAALAPLGAEYVALLQEGTDPRNGWIDVYPSNDKDSGAFSASVYGRHPYVKMNYQDSLDDLSTLAHEYGHAIHSHLAMTHQPYWNYRYVPFLAEIASTCNEALLSDYLVRQADSKAAKAGILAAELESIRQTIYRQTLFSEFERAVHTFVEEGTPVTATLLDDTYARPGAALLRARLHRRRERRHGVGLHPALLLQVLRVQLRHGPELRHRHRREREGQRPARGRRLPADAPGRLRRGAPGPAEEGGRRPDPPRRHRGGAAALRPDGQRVGRIVGDQVVAPISIAPKGIPDYIAAVDRVQCAVDRRRAHPGRCAQVVARRSFMIKVATAAVRFSLILTACLALVSQAAGQDLRANLFSEVDAVMAQGKADRSDILAPKSWGNGMEKYVSAERKFADGKNIDDIRKDLTAATGFFQGAIKATDLAALTLATPLKARDDAAKVEAAKSASALWSQAESKFAEAGRKLEEGNVNDARKRGAEAETLYRDAELSAIKTSFFDETRKLLAKADQDKVEKYAPATLARSRSLLAEAESALNENRYDIDRPRSLAMEARYEALHALQLAKMVKLIDDKTMSREELILAAEAPLIRVAGALDVQVGFDEGFTRPTDTIVQAIEGREAAQDGLASEVRDRDARVTALTDQVAQLEQKLGGVSESQQALQAQVEAQAMASRRFAQVEQKFTRDEARVLREGGDVVIRLLGMNFSSGQSEIRPDHFTLLTKVKEAIAMYPGAKISIEGHTDAYGTDEANLKLSQTRANAVAQYLLANSSLSATNVQAVGFGETKPIANNETKEGREKNRRIDIVITPAP